MVSGIYLYPDGREQVRDDASDIEHFDCMVSDRILAWSQLEFRFMGLIFWPSPDGRKAVSGKAAAKNPCMGIAYLCGCSGNDKLGDICV